MNKRTIAILCVIVLLFTSIVSGCASREEIKVDVINKEIADSVEFVNNTDNIDEYGAYQLSSDMYSHSKLNFECAVEKDTFYKISTLVYSDDLNSVHKDEKAIFFSSNMPNEINAEYVTSNSINSPTITNDGEYSWEEITFCTYSYDNETLLFSLQIGNESNEVKGNLYIDEITVTPINNDSIISSDDGSVVMAFNNSVDDDLEALVCYANALSNCRKSMVNFVGDDYTSGKTVFIITQDIEVFGLAGTPIYVDSKQYDSIISSANFYFRKNKFDDVLFAFVHEMSHTFDRICGECDDKLWQFDSEVLASTKAIFALSDNGLSYSNDDVFLLFKSYNTEDNNVFSDEFLTRKLIEIAYRDGWNVFSSVIKRFGKINPSDVDTAKKKFDKFVEIYNSITNTRFENNFTKKEWNMIYSYYSIQQ